MSHNHWERFFDAHAPHYMDNGFTRNTVREVDFIVEELKLEKGSSILDVGCGVGRHAVELARRGYRVTGVDLSEGMLREARRAASEARVEVEWVHADATAFETAKTFDAAICLCEGAFGLIGLDEDPEEHDNAILRNVSGALKPLGRFILTTLNAYSKIRSFAQEDVESGRFDPAAMIERFADEWELPEGKRRIEMKERRYFPSELKRMFAEHGLQVEHVWGGTAGAWERRPIRLDEIEIMLTASKR